MPTQKPMIDREGEVRELTAKDMADFRPTNQALPQTLHEKMKGRGPQKTPTKERITIRLSPDVLAPFRVTGKGWQSRVDAALKDWLKSHTPSN
tara:strand:- start:520 stop:798 length:279 start_codon:yes stop_codon:yes gene_type:complete